MGPCAGGWMGGVVDSWGEGGRLRCQRNEHREEGFERVGLGGRRRNAWGKCSTVAGPHQGH